MSEPPGGAGGWPEPPEYMEAVYDTVYAADYVKLDTAVAKLIDNARAEERAEFARLVREKLTVPDVSATAAEHLIGFKSGWRTAIRRVLDELSE
jgi:hypothetical protein